MSYGDDYKLCYTCSSELKDNEYISEDFCIGKIKSDKKIIIKKDNSPVNFKKHGWDFLNKKIGIIGGGITGLIVGIFLAKEGHKVSIFEKSTLLSETSSKTTKLLHGGLRYLENFYFNEVKNGLNDELENFPKQTRKLKIVIPFKSRFSLALIKFFFGIKLYKFLAGSKNLGESSMSKQIKYDLLP